MKEDKAHYPPQSPMDVGIRGRCPRCGQGRLFDGYLSLAPGCRACGLDFAFADSADGPAIFVILIVGFVIAGAALLVELGTSPPLWVHALLWAPLILLFSLGLLRPLKGVMVAQQFVHKAEEGKRQDVSGEGA